MSLGFTVETLLPAARGGGALAMGLRRIAGAEWLFPEVDRAARAAAFDADPGAVRVLPCAEDAAAEATALVGHPGSLGDAARAVWEDLCVLQPGDDGNYVLTAAAVGFPTDWRLANKIGRGLTAIHAPIHGYAEQLAGGVDHLLATLAPGTIVGRANWFVVADAAWRYLPADDPTTRFAHVTAANAGETLVVRCERQTLRRLPESGAVLFTIGIAVSPLGALSDGAVMRVAEGSGRQSAGEHDRRAGPFYARALAGYAASRGARRAA